MTNVVPLSRETPALKRMRERLARATAAVKQPQRIFVEELVATMVEASAAGVDQATVTAAAMSAIADMVQDLHDTTLAAHAELQRLLNRIRGVTT